MRMSRARRSGQGRSRRVTYHRPSRWATCVRARSGRPGIRRSHCSSSRSPSRWSRPSTSPGFAVSLGGTSVRIVPGDVVLAVSRRRARRSRSSARAPIPRAAVPVDGRGARVRRAHPRRRRSRTAAPPSSRPGSSSMLAALARRLRRADRLDRPALGRGRVARLSSRRRRSPGGSWASSQNPGSRQASFLGEHDLAALSTACLDRRACRAPLPPPARPAAARRGHRRVRSGSFSEPRSRACSASTWRSPR